MISLNPIKAYLAPYALYLKLALLAALFLSGMFTGCQVQKKLDAEKLSKANSALLYYRDQATASGNALEAVNAQTKANQQAAEEWREKATEASKLAEKEKDKNADLQLDFAKRLKAASKSPDCKAIMEMNLCPILRDY